MPKYRIKAVETWVAGKLRRSDEADPTVTMTEQEAQYLVMSGALELAVEVAPAPAPTPVAKRPVGKSSRATSTGSAVS